MGRRNLERIGDFSGKDIRRIQAEAAAKVKEEHAERDRIQEDKTRERRFRQASEESVGMNKRELGTAARAKR
ncbi:hypothetical protein ACFL0L_03845 [Patescibacteria group bacterium]